MIGRRSQSDWLMGAWDRWSALNAFMTQEPALPFQSATITGQCGIRADYPVTRNNDGNRVCSISHPNRSHRFWPAHPYGEAAVGRGFARWDRS